MLFGVTLIIQVHFWVVQTTIKIISVFFSRFSGSNRSTEHLYRCSVNSKDLWSDIIPLLWSILPKSTSFLRRPLGQWRVSLYRLWPLTWTPVWQIQSQLLVLKSMGKYNASKLEFTWTNTDNGIRNIMEDQYPPIYLSIILKSKP